MFWIRAFTLFFILIPFPANAIQPTRCLAFTEPTANTDGTALTDLSHHAIYAAVTPATGKAESEYTLLGWVPASKSTGGGQLQTTIVLPVEWADKTINVLISIVSRDIWGNINGHALIRRSIAVPTKPCTHVTGYTTLELIPPPLPPPHILTQGPPIAEADIPRPTQPSDTGPRPELEPAASIVPANTWVMRPSPAWPGSPGDNKHVKPVYNSDDHKLYFWGGDYCVFESYFDADRCNSHEEWWSYDVATNTWGLLLDQEAAIQDNYPEGRCLAALAYDPIRKVVWMTSGQYRFDPDLSIPDHNARTRYRAAMRKGGLWAWNPTTKVWTKEGPSVEAGESQYVNAGLWDVYEYMAYIPGFNMLWGPSRINAHYSLEDVLIGDNNAVQDNWRRDDFTGEDYLFGTVAFAFDTKRLRAVVYASQTCKTYSYEFAEKRTTVLSDQCLPAKSVYGMDYDVENDLVVLFGGFSAYEGEANINPRNDVWTFDGNSWRVRVLAGTPPSPRKGETLIYDPHSKVHVVYGGGGGLSLTPGQNGGEVFLFRLQ
jgi:hypothetical protein